MARLRRFKIKQSFARRLCSSFKQIDLYGKNISLSFEGEEKFKTYIGAVTSFFIGTTMIIYFLYFTYFSPLQLNVCFNIKFIFNFFAFYLKKENVMIVIKSIDYIRAI